MKRINLTLFSICSVILLLNACSSLGPPIEDEDPSAPQGPGLLTGESGEFSISEYLANKEKQKQQVQQGNTRPSAAYSINADNLPAMTEEDFKEFEAFQQWLRAREQSSPEYNEYLDWKTYQQFRRVRQEQSQKQ